MKTFKVVTVLILSLLCHNALADDSEQKVDSGDPCTVAVCMWGKVTGNSQGECSGAEKKFFSFNSFKKKGRFDPSNTLKQRANFLGSCPLADPAQVSQILSKFGKIKG